MPTTEELLKQAQALNEAKEYDKVIALLTYEILLQCQNADLFAEAALASYRAKRKDLSLKYADFALAIDSMHAKGNYYKGLWYKEHKDYERAIAAYKRVISTNPLFPMAYNSLGNSYMQLNKYDDAIIAYKKAIQIDKKNPAPYNGLGNAYQKKRSYAKAIKEYNKAIKYDPKHPHHYNGLGCAYYALKNYDEALKNYFKSLECDREFSFSYYNRALI